MAWTSFKFGRPGSEFTFDVPPAAMTIEPTAIKSMQRNLAGDLKKSVLKVDVPKIKINSTYLTLAQRNQFASLIGVSDSFLSFLCRDDWQTIYDLVSIIDLTHVKLSNGSALKLSAAYVQMGLASIITIITPFAFGTGPAYGLGTFGGGPYGIGSGGGTFDPGSISYDDVTRIITLSNPLPSASLSIYVTYTFPGWLVEMDSMSHQAQGGWLDRFTYDISLVGA